MLRRPTTNILWTLAFAISLSGCVDGSAGFLAPASVESEDETAQAGPTCVDVAGCDDGDPCTEDTCVGDACEHVAIVDCTIQACNALGLMDTTDLTALADGGAWKASGKAVAQGDPSQCTDADCDASDPCCNACDSGLGLEVAGEVVHAVSSNAETHWACSVDECGQSYACEPLALGSSYWLWGKVVRDGALPTYLVEGWCRQTTVQDLPGKYVGTWVSGAGEAQTVQLTFDHLGSWNISLKGIRDCETCAFSVPMQYATGVVVRDGEVEFMVSVCSDGVTCSQVSRRDVRVKLSSNKDRLIGTFEEVTMIQGLGEPYSGAIGLERMDP